MRTTIDLTYLRPGELTKEEVAGIVGADKMRALTEQYGHPDLRCFVIAHEGFVSGEAENKNAWWFEYLKQTIRQVYRAVTSGLPAYFRHQGIGSPTREPIGEVVGKQLREDSDGIMYTVAVFLIYPEFKHLQLDVASMECNVVLDANEYGEAKVVEIQDVKAVALSSSTLDEPGFPNARLVAAFQYFKDQNEKGDSKMTIEEIKNWLKENAARPSDIFTLPEITRDAEVNKEIEARLQTKHEHARRLETKLSEVEKAAIEEKNGLLEQVKAYQKRIVEANASGATEKALAAITDEKVRVFVKKKLDAALPGAVASIEDPEKVSEAVKALADGILAEVEELKGIVAPPDKKEETHVARKTQAGGAISKPAETVVDDNELIPSHLAV